jgi:hypothetical protein
VGSPLGFASKLLLEILAGFSLKVPFATFSKLEAMQKFLIRLGAFITTMLIAYIGNPT